MIKGYSLYGKTKKYRARIRKDGEVFLLGYFNTEGEAKAAYEEANNNISKFRKEESPEELEYQETLKRLREECKSIKPPEYIPKINVIDLQIDKPLFAVKSNTPTKNYKSSTLEYRQKYYAEHKEHLSNKAKLKYKNLSPEQMENKRIKARERYQRMKNQKRS